MSWIQTIGIPSPPGDAAGNDVWQWKAKPDVFVVFHCGEDAASDNMIGGFSICADGESYSASASADHGLVLNGVKSNTGSRADVNKAISLVYQDADWLVCGVDHWAKNTAVDYTTYTAGARKGFALGFGDLLDWDLREVGIVNTSAQDIDFGWPDVPDLCILISCWSITSGANAFQPAHLTFGCSTWDGTTTDQGGVCGWSNDNVGTTDADREFDDNGIPFLATGAARGTTQHVAMEHDPATHSMTGGVRLTAADFSGASTGYHYLLSLRGIKAKLVHDTCPTSAASNNSITGAKFAPTHFVTFGNQKIAPAGSGTHWQMNINAGDAVNQYGIELQDKNAQGTSDSGRRYGESEYARNINNSQIVKYSSTLASMDGDGITETPVTVDLANLRGNLFMAPISERDRQRNARTRRGRLSLV